MQHRWNMTGVLAVEGEPEQDALFEIEGPDEDGCVWIHGTDRHDPWTQNLGPRDKVAEALSQWLASLDDGEGKFQLTQDE